jgi:hypothetical protein
LDTNAIAYFIPASSLPRLCDAAESAAPGELGDRYDAVLDAETTRRAEFDGPGEFVAVALAFLDETGVGVHAAHQGKAERLSARREASHTIFTRGLARAVLPRLRATPIDVAALVRYDAKLRGAASPADAAPLKAAVRFVHDVLRSVRPGEEALLVIRLTEQPVASPAQVARPRGFADTPRAGQFRTAW